jgi:hypothetical protein
MPETGKSKRRRPLRPQRKPNGNRKTNQRKEIPMTQLTTEEKIERLEELVLILAIANQQAGLYEKRFAPLVETLNADVRRRNQQVSVG